MVIASCVNNIQRVFNRYEKITAFLIYIANIISITSSLSPPLPRSRVSINTS